MADFFNRRNVAAVMAFTDASAIFEFGFEATEQLIHNDGNGTVEVSFDGVNVHARLQITGPSKVVHWSDHVRRRVWVRNAGGGGPRNVEVLATTR